MFSLSNSLSLKLSFAFYSFSIARSLSWYTPSFAASFCSFVSSMCVLLLLLFGWCCDVYVCLILVGFVRTLIEM